MEYFKDFNKEQFYNELNNDIFLFTFLRDPIDHFLSGFFEAVIRKKKKRTKLFKQNQQKGNNNLYGLLNDTLISMQQKQYQQWNITLNPIKNTNHSYIGCGWNRYGKNSKFRSLSDFEYTYHFDMHIRPQTTYLLNSKWNFFNFNYLGSLNNISNDLYFMVNKFLSTKGYNSINETAFNKYLTHERDNTDTKYNKGISKINRNNLTDSQIQMICELNWIDYVCIDGFRIPNQCNIEYLKQKYKDYVDLL